MHCHYIPCMEGPSNIHNVQGQGREGDWDYGGAHDDSSDSELLDHVKQKVIITERARQVYYIYQLSSFLTTLTGTWTLVEVQEGLTPTS